MEFLNEMIQWLSQDLLVSLVDESSVFEWISWMNDSKTNTFLIDSFRYQKINKKDAHTGIDQL